MKTHRRLLVLLSALLPALAFAVPERSLLNLSMRATAGGGGPAALASSFTIEGSASKTVLVRALGPTLAAAPTNLVGTITDPALVITNGFAQVVAQNDNWGSAATSAALVSAASAAGAIPLLDGSKDAAVLVTLAPGTYTARVDGVSGATGTAQLEIFDTDTAPRLAYLNANSRIAIGGATTFVGFAIGAGSDQQVLVRAIGPALFSVGAGGTLSNPSLTLRNSSAVVVGTNDNWGNAAANATVATAATTAGLRPLADGSNDAAFLVTLPPGVYTAEITGVGGSTGNVLFELAIVDADRTDFAPALLGPVLPVANASGGSVLPYALAVGRPTPSFQWRKNGTDISGAIFPALNLVNLADADAANYSVTVSNTSGSVITLNSSATVWSKSNPSLLTGSLYSVAHNGAGVYAAVGDSGLIFTASSADLSAWTRITTTGSQLRSIAFGGGKFVAVGGNGVVRVSSDNGATWSAQAFPAAAGSNQLNGVLYDGTRFVAVGNNSTVLYSTDGGTTWTAGTLGTASINLNAVAYKSAGNYVAVASNGTAYVTADVTTGSWTALLTTSAGTNTTNTFNAVAYVTDRFIAVGNSGTVRTSTTGAAPWTTVTSNTSTNLFGVAHSGSLYVATGGNTLITSPDATTWTTGTFLPVGSASSNNLIYANSQFLSVGFPGTIVTSPTGATNTWTLRSGSTTINYNDTVYANGRYIAVGANGGILTTTDGIALTSLAPVQPSLSSTTLRRVAYGAGTFVAVGDSGVVLSSPDGTTWTNRAFSAINYTALAYAAGKFVVGGASGAFATSTDGITWTLGTGTIGTANITGLAYGGATGRFVAVNSTGGIYASTDAVAWAAQTSNTTNALNNVRFGGGQFFALGAASTILTSPDGLTWTNRGLSTSSSINLVDVTHGGGLNLAVHTTSGTGFNNVIFASADGVTWTPTSIGTNTGTPLNFFSQAGITYGNGVFFVASNSGIVARSAPNTALQRILTQPVAATTIAAGGSATLTVTTSAASGATFQWYRGFSGDTSTPVSGATNASLTTSTSGRYWVLVSGASSPAINSATAAITGPTPTISTQPVATTITAGQGGSLSVVGATTGAGPLSYQWRKFGSPVAGATSATLSLSATTLFDAGYYDVVVSDGLASVTSKGVRVDVVPATASYGTIYRPRASAPRIEVNSGNITAIAVDPADSNKLYVAGEFTRINSTVRLNVARFLADGSFDSTWTPVSVIGGGSIRAILVESDGIIIGGDFSFIGGASRGRLAKLSKTDGSLITGFASGAGASATVYSLARQVMADSSVRYLVGGSFSSYNGTTVNRLVRIDNTGAIDSTFVLSPTGTAGFGSDVRALVVDGTGATATIYAGGLFTSHHGVTTNRNRLLRLTSTGAYDSTFNVGTGFNNNVLALALSGTGAAAKLYVGGTFTSVDVVTTNRNRIARLDATGAYETSFAVGSGFGSDVNALALDSAGNVYVAGGFTSFNGVTSNRNRLLRLTSAGAYDTTFSNNLAGANSTVNALLLLEDTTTQANSRLLFGGFFTTWNTNNRDSFARVATDATAVLDAAPAATFRRPGTVYAVEPAPNGKWYIGGTFNFIDDLTRNHFARLNADGTLDVDFTNPGTGFSSNVNTLAVQGDGRIVAAGNFTSFNGTTRSDILRLLPDGTLDFTFNPGTGFNSNVNGLQLLSDGRIVAAGNFTTYNGTTRNRLARLLPDGTLDTTFDPIAGFTQNFNAPAPLALQSDGKLLVGGNFTTYNGTTANGIVRVLDTGLIDGIYNTGGAGFASSIDVRSLFTRLNDTVLAVGGFTTYNGTARSRVIGLLDTGAVDTGFVPNSGPNNLVTAMAPQSDGKLLIAGFYSNVSGTNRASFARVNANGTFDSSFNVPTAVSLVSNVNVIRADASGNLLVGATRLDFTEFLGRGSLVVLEPAPVAAITDQPVAQTGAGGGSATFSVTATGENLQYQWLKNGAPVSGATNASLVLTNLTLADAANYSVVVSNLYSTVTSTAVSLSGSAPLPTISAQPVASTGTAGGSTSLTVAATGTGPLGYQWRKFGVPVAGATTATLNLSNLGLDAAGYYDVVVNDGLSVRASAGAQVTVGATAAAGGLRPRASFEPRVELVGIVTKFASHADGRFYVTGSFTQLDGSVAQGIVRLLANGTRDPSWTPPLITGSVNHVAIQSNDQVVIAGTFGYVGGVNQFRLARLNSDGTLDTAFAVKVGSGVSGGTVNAIAIQPADQKILLAGQFTSINGYAANRLIRLNADGSPDSSLALGTGFDNNVNALLLQPDGKIVVAGNFLNYNGTFAPRIIRLSALGAVDTTFATGTGFEFAPAALAFQPADNKIVAVGSFVTYNGVTSNGIVRLSSLGARESGFPTGTGFGSLTSTVGPLSVALQTVGSTDYLVIGGNFTSYNGATINRLVRLAATDGAVDTALNTTLGAAGLSSTARSVVIQGSTNQILVGGPITAVNTTGRSGLIRFNADGSLDSLNRQFLEPGQVFAVQPVANGKFIIGGAFAFVGGTPVANLARLDATGALDPTFTPGTGPGGTVRAIVQQGDGKLVIGGAFTAYNGVTAGVNRLARLSADGVLDTAFATAFGTGFNNQVNALALLPDGRIAAGGTFTTLNSVTTNRVARLSAGGAPDTAFNTANANGTAFNGTVLSLVAHADGRLSAAGSFSTLNNVTSAGIARLLPAGGTDTSFAVGSGFALNSTQTGSMVVNALALQPDDKLIAGGFFGTYNGAFAQGLTRLTATGGLDPAFAPGLATTSTVQALTLQADGRLLVAGNFSSFNGQRRGGLIRLSATGGLDLSFGAPFAFGAPTSAINVVTPLADGSLLVGSTTRQDFIDRIVSGLMLLESAPSPTLLTLPFGGAVAAGNTTTVLGVSVAAAQPVTYVWKHNGVAITDDSLDRLGAATSTLSFINFQAADAGTYTVTVTDSLGASVTTPPVVFAVIESAPVLGTISANFGSTYQAGTAGYLTIPYTGSAPTSFAWTKNGVAVTGGYYNSGALHLPILPARPGDAGVYQVSATNALGTTTSVPTRVWVSEEAGWTPHNPLPSPQGLTQVVVNNGSFLATGVRGARVTSTDGITWTQLPALGQNNLLGYAEGNGRKLLVGSLGFLALSTDGTNWRTLTLPTVETVQSVAFGAGVFVVSTSYSDTSSGRAKIFSSPDGETWTERYSTGLGSLNSLAFGNGIFAVFTSDVILRSSNGTDWTSHPAPSTGTLLRFANGQFFLPSGSFGDLHVSTDALTWTTRSYGATGVRDLNYANNQYLLTGDNGLLLTSPDAVTWTRRTTNTTSALRSAAYANSTWTVISNSSFPATILTSTDSGVTWTNRTTSVTYEDLSQLATDGSTSVISVAPNGTIIRSTNGTTWSTVTSGVTDELMGAAYGAGKYIAVGANGRILTSPTGTTWTTATSGTTTALEDAIFLNGQFLVSGDSGLLLRSADGVTWTSATLATNGFNLQGIAYGAGRYVTISRGGVILTSTDAATWTAATSGTTADLNGIAYGNGKFLVPAGNQVLTSTDGLTWTSAPAPELPGWDSGTIFLAGRFYAGGGINGLLSSADGLTWTGHHLGTNYGDVNGAVVFNGRMIITGEAGMIYSAALAPAILQQPLGQVIATGTPIVLRTQVAASPLPTTYQWRRGGQPISGATSATFTISSPSSADVGFYDVVVTNSSGTIISSAAGLSLTAGVAPTIAQQASFGLGTIVQTGSVVDLQFTVTGDAPISVQFMRNSTVLGGAVAPDAANVAHRYIFNATPADSGPYTGIASNATGLPAIATNNQAQFVVDDGNWHWRHPFPTALALNNVATTLKTDGTTEFVAMGSRGALYTSPNGTEWSHYTNRGTGTITGYVTGSFGGKPRHILYGGAWLSVDDGEYHFTPTNLGSFESINEIVYGQNVFVAICSSGKIFSSPDGFAWTLRTTVATEGVFELTFGNGTFVASTQNGLLLRSTDGLTWTSPAAGPTAGVWLLRHANGTFFLGSASGELYTSTDAVTWTVGASGVTTRLSNLAFAGGRYVIVGDAGTILTSDNGTAWTKQTVPAGVAAINLTGIAQTNGVWIAIGTNNSPSGNALLRSSDNGVTWTNQFGGATSAQLNGVAANGTSSLIAVGNNGTLLRSTSLDTGWTPITSGAGSNALNEVTYNGTAYFAAGNAGVIRTSTDNGVTWTASANALTVNTQNLLWIGSLKGVLHAAGAAGTLLNYNGSAWSTVTTGSTQQLNGVAYGLVGSTDTYVAVGNSGTILTSSTGAASSWTSVASTASQALNEVAFGNNTFVAVGGGGTIVSSSNGTTWTNRSIPSFPEGFTHVTFLYGHFIVSGSPSGVFVSPDGINWTARYTGTSNPTSLRATAAFGTEDIVGVGAGGAILVTTFVTYLAEELAPLALANGATGTLRFLTDGAVLPTSVQWRRAGVAIPGATNRTFTIANATRADAGLYDVVLTTAAGSSISNPSIVTVAPTAYPGQIAADPTWDPNPLTISTRTFAAVKLASGKFLAGGESVRWDGQPRTALARLNADLTLDTTWTPPLINGVVYALAASADGSVVYVGGDFTAVDGHTRPGLFRLVGPNLNLDLLWRPLDPLPAGPSQISALALQDNGQLLVARLSFVTGAVTGTSVLRRLDFSGTHDTTFSVDVTTAVAGQRIHSLVAEPGANSAIAFAGNFTAVNGTARGGLARVNSTGATLDTVFGGTGANNAVNFLTRLSDGRYVVGGNFTQVNSLTRNRVALLTAATGAVDTTFVPPSTGTTTGNAHAVVELFDGRLLVFGNFTQYASNNAAGFIRLNGTTGAFDSALTVGTGAQTVGFNISGAGRNMHGFRLNDQDEVGYIGTFNELLGQRRVAAARINAGVSNTDATDVSKTLVATPSVLVHRPAFTGAAFLEQSGALTVFGSADIAGGTSGIGQILRVNPNGSIDSTFPGGAGFGLNGLSTFGIYRAVRQGDGKYVATGDFNSYNGASVNRIVRINADGTRDTTFNPTGAGPSNFIVTPVALAGGKVALFGSLGGSFTYGGVAAPGNILRLNADGTRDTSFVAAGTSPNIGFNSAPSFVMENPNQDGDDAGSLLVVGPFTSYGGVTVPGIAMLNANGSLDSSFTYGGAGPTGGSVIGAQILGPGRLALFGSFTSFNGTAVNRVVILTGDPFVVDTTFTAPAALDAQVNQLIQQEDGKLIAVGEFSSGPALRLTAAGAVDNTFALRGVTGFPGGSSGARFIMADDGSLYLHNTLVSLDYGAPRGLVRFKGAATTPTIAQAPHGGALTVGSPFVFSVRAAGTAPYTYQWKKNDADISGATDSVYLLPSAASADAGNYSVVVTGPGGTVTSVPVALAEVTTVAIADQPASRKVAAGATVQLAVSASTTVSAATLTYEWRKAGTAIPGATTSALTLTRVTAADAASYTVVVGDGTGTATSQPAVLTVTTPDPVLWQQFTEYSTEQAPARTVHDGAGKVYVPWSVQERAPDMANGKLIGALARFDEATGALDTTFRLDPRFRRASHVAIQPDGKLLVAVSLGDTNTVVRVTTSGAIDTATPFTAPFFARGIRFITRQADGKVLVVAADNLDANAPATALGADALAVYRLNADGTLDTGFTRATANANIFGPPVVDSTGRIYLAGQFNTINGTSRLGVARLTSTGALDSSFPTGLPAGFTYSQIRAVALQSGDRPVFVGDFFAAGIRGTTGDRVMAFRFSSAGAFDSTFAQPLRSELGLAAGFRLRHLIVESDDTILAVSDRVVRLTANGAKDATFPSRVFGKEAFWISRGANNHLFFADQTSVFGQNIALSTVSNGIAVISPTGTGVSFSFQTGGWGRIAYPTDAAVLSDGRYWLAGNFNRVGATPVPGLALFEADGTPATAQIGTPRSMASSTVAPTLNDHVFALVGQPSNSTETGLSTSLVRFTPGRTADSSFAPVLPSGYDLSTATLNPAPVGKLVLAQSIISAQAALNGATGDALLRLNADGTRDTGYAPALSSFAVVERSSANGPVTMIRTGGLNVAQILPDGGALVIGTAIDGTLRLFRLTATGAMDATFTAPSFGSAVPSSGFTTTLTDPVTSTSAQFAITTYSAADLVRTAVQMPDGKTYVGGRFQLGYANAPRGLARLNADGTIDPTFTGVGLAFSKPDAGPYVSKLAVDPVGRLYVGGRFDSYNGTAVPGLCRLLADGTLDTAWAPGFGVLDAPRADVNFLLVGDKLHAFGTVGLANDPLPTPHRVVTLASSPVTLPATGSGGSTVAIGGFGFTGATAVNFNGVAATFTVISDTSIVATVPALATTGAVTIVTPGGTQTVAGSFTVTAGASLANLSRMGTVGPNNSVVLLNFTIEGATSSVLVRAAGPALTALGVPGTLADPVLTLHDATGAEIARNDNWGGESALLTAMVQVGAFPFSAAGKDAALLASLAPGTYTARVTGAGTSTGIALAEVYLTPGSARFAHLAARTGHDGSGSTVGFVLSGAGTQTVLIRAIGSPLVTALGAASNPSIRVYGSTSTEIAANDNWVASADLTAATAAAGALPLAADDSALLLALAPGYYTVNTTVATTGFALTEVHVIDSFRAAAFKAALLAPLQSTTVSAGDPVYFNAPVLAKPAAVTYVWKKDGSPVTTGVAVSGSPGALRLPAALAGDTGLYTVEMTNSAGTTVSAPVTLAVNPPAGYAATQTLVGPGYLPGGTITVTNTLSYPGTSASLGWSVTLPPGWSYVSSTGQAGETQPSVGATGNLVWAWTTVPANSVTFSYTVNVPAGETAARALTAFAVARPGGTPVIFVANPNPLPVSRVLPHTGDTNQDFRFSLIELTRVIELFNTRNGTVRTGRYRVQSGTEDGFNPDAATADGATVTLTKYHSADTTQDGKIGLVELTRVIELYNTRSGTVRTGAYHPDATNLEDGYNPGP